MRSKAEQTFARWLYEHKINFEYERWHYVLPTGEGYVPDFWLPDVGVFVEVKAGQVQTLHKPWILAHVVSREERVPLYVWSYGIMWRPRDFGWSSDVIWTRCTEEDCGAIFPVPTSQLSSCRGCGRSTMTFMSRELRRSPWRASDPIRTWRPSKDNREAIAA